MPHTPPDSIINAWKGVRAFSEYYRGSERPADLSGATTRYLGTIYHFCGTLAALDDFPPHQYKEAVDILFGIMENINARAIKPDAPDADCAFAQAVEKRAKTCLADCTEAFLQAMEETGQETATARLRLDAMKEKWGLSTQTKDAGPTQNR